MNTLDTNVFTSFVCPCLTGKIIDDILLVNKHYNKVVKADMKHLYNLYWKIEEDEGYKYKHIYKDGKKEGEQLSYRIDGQLKYKLFYKEGNMEGEQLSWYEKGQLYSKEFYNEGKFEGEQESWHRNGQLATKHFYKDKKLEGEQLSWWDNGKLYSKSFYKEGKQLFYPPNKDIQTIKL